MLCIVEGMEFGAMKIMGAFVLVIGIIILFLELRIKLRLNPMKKFIPYICMLRAQCIIIEVFK